MIELKSVVKTYQNITAVDNISLKIDKGETCVLIGPSGCGKSTTLKMINKMIVPDSGDIFINNKSVNDFKDYELRRSIGYVIQSVGLFPHMTVYENIKTVPSLLKWDKKRMEKRVSELLELFKMKPSAYKDKYPFELSGGEAQRVGVARALAADPEILLMDEPFAALDPITRESLQLELIRVQKVLNKTIVFVTHDMEEAVKISTRVAVLRIGGLVQYDTPEKLLTSPRDSFVSRFIGSDRGLMKLGRISVGKMVKSAQSVFMTENMGEVIKKYPDSLFLWVIDENKRFVGWINKYKNFSRDQKVSDVMNEAESLFGIEPECSFRDVLEKMIREGVELLPVLDSEGVLQGQVWGRDILRMNNGSE
ncbi:MAG: ATP-binding cassette domain-containing protein [Thermodesulfobacteriota bacterium]